MIIGNSINNLNHNDFIGIILGLTAAVFYAFFMLTSKFIHNIDKLELTIIQLCITAIFLFIYIAFTSDLSFLNLSASSIPFIIILGIVNTGIEF